MTVYTSRSMTKHDDQDHNDGKHADQLREAAKQAWSTAQQGAKQARDRYQGLLGDVVEATQRAGDIVDEVGLLDDLRSVGEDVREVVQRLTNLDADEPSSESDRPPAAKPLSDGESESSSSSTRSQPSKQSSSQQSTSAKQSSSKPSSSKSGSSKTHSPKSASPKSGSAGSSAKSSSQSGGSATSTRSSSKGSTSRTKSSGSSTSGKRASSPRRNP